MSVDYLVRLEQGRATNPSAATLGALARALRLNTTERDMLYSIAGSAPPGSGTVPTYVPPGVQRMMDRLDDTPVAVFSAIWTIIQWNTLWASLQSDPLEWEGKNKNLVWRHFVGGGSRNIHSAESQQALQRELVSDLRIASIKYPQDPELKSLTKALRLESSGFNLLWNRYEAHASVSSQKTVLHPTVGDITLDCEVLTVAGHDVRIIVYTAAPGTSDADKLELLRVIGVQDLTVQ